MRTDDMFDLFFEHIESSRKRTDTEEPTLPRKRRVPSRYELGEGEGYHSPTVKDHYRCCYYEALDLVISSIQERFNQPGYVVYRNLEELLLKAVNAKDYSSELDYVTEFYGSDLDKNELSTQLKILASNIRDEVHLPSSETITLPEILSFIRKLSNGQRAFFKQVCWIVRLILVVPSTNASSERSFSTMKRLKTYLRSTMGQSRLNHLMVLNIYKEILDSMDMISIANEFVQANEHRLHIFGKF